MSGDRKNTGYRNTGDWNTGDWNTGDWNTGFFNTTTPKDVNCFNVPTSRDDWNNARKPAWIFKPEPTTWVSDADMTDQEKTENPTFQTCGGYLRINDMASEWHDAFHSASLEDIQAVRDLPNFDAAVFEEITGLDLSETKAASCDGKTVEIYEDAAGGA